MKKIILVFVVLFVFIGVTGGFSSSLAVELCPFLRFGTINWREGDIDEGHKYLRGGGLKIKSNLIDGLRGTVTMQGWEMGEPLDEDRELPYRGYSIEDTVFLEKLITIGRLGITLRFILILDWVLKNGKELKKEI